MLRETFVVLAHPRSGSTHFCKTILSSHPLIVCFDEIFNKYNNPSTQAIKALGMAPYHSRDEKPHPQYPSELSFWHALSKTAAEKAAKEIIGFKLFLYQVPDSTLMHILDTHKVILLKRFNVLQAAISYAIALNTNQWHAPAKRVFHPFALEAAQLLAFIRYWINSLNACEYYLQRKGIAYLSLRYETLFTQDTLRSVESFLELAEPFCVTDFGSTKLNEKERYNLIVNIDEIRSQFLRMGYPDIYQPVYEENRF